MISVCVLQNICTILFMNLYFTLNIQFKTKHSLRNNDFKEHFGGDTSFLNYWDAIIQIHLYSFPKGWCLDHINLLVQQNFLKKIDSCCRMPFRKIKQKPNTNVLKISWTISVSHSLEHSLQHPPCILSHRWTYITSHIVNDCCVMTIESQRGLGQLCQTFNDIYQNRCSHFHH